MIILLNLVWLCVSQFVNGRLADVVRAAWRNPGVQICSFGWRCWLFDSLKISKWCRIWLCSAATVATIIMAAESKTHLRSTCKFMSPQIHLVSALWLPSALHPERGSAAVWSGPRSLSADRRGSTPQHLAPLQDAARFPASPSAAEIQEYNHHLPQEDQRRLHHRAELRQPPDIQTLPLQRGTGGRWQAMADAVKAGQADRCQRNHKSVWFLVCSSLRLATLICCGYLPLTGCVQEASMLWCCNMGKVCVVCLLSLWIDGLSIAWMNVTAQLVGLCVLKVNLELSVLDRNETAALLILHRVGWVCSKWWFSM